MRILFAEDQDKQLIKELFIREWNSDLMVSRGYSHYVENLQSILAVDINDKILGILTYHQANNEIEIVSLDSFDEGKGIGTKLLDFALLHFKSLDPKRVWLITSNDNCNAIRFYQKRGWEMVNIHLNTISEARKVKPEIPLIGYDGIPILHEIEFEYNL